jgi:transposase
MACINFPISLPGIKITEVRKQDNQIDMYAASVEIQGICPNCGKRSTRVHSYYERTPADFPMAACQVRMHLRMKRFRCLTEDCSRATFVEEFPHVLEKYARRTVRLYQAQEDVAFALGGEAGCRLANHLHMALSGDTLLRMIRNAPAHHSEEAEIIGVDDWAKRRGRVYGTILVDLERHQVIDLLADRTAETLVEWLRSHPGVQIVARDRSLEYARGISEGAPQAIQVADRWHLLVNLREALQRLLDRIRPELNALAPAASLEKREEIPILRHRSRSQQAESARQTRQRQRRTLHAKIHRLCNKGLSMRTIARQLRKSPTTIYKYLAMPEFPQQIARKPISSILDPYRDDLSQRWQESCRNARQLWREIRQRGFPGTYRQVSRWAYERRQIPAPTTPRKHLEENHQGQLVLSSIRPTSEKQQLPVARRLVWLFLLPIEKLEEDEVALRRSLLNHTVLLQQGCELVYEFQRTIHDRDTKKFSNWLQACEHSEIPEFMNLAVGMKKDQDAIKAAVSSQWSNGQTEGQVNRLKLLKRQMYGRANFDLLTSRFLHPP